MVKRLTKVSLMQAIYQIFISDSCRKWVLTVEVYRFGKVQTQSALYCTHRGCQGNARPMVHTGKIPFEDA